MDRGVKIAIFVASLASLALGLIWDQVLSQARVLVEQHVADEMGPERVEAEIGPPHIPRREPPREIFQPTPPESPSDLASVIDLNRPADTPAIPAGPMEYVVQARDSWWSLARRKFVDRGYESRELAEYNHTTPDVALRVGARILIPPPKGAESHRIPDAPSTAPLIEGPTEYTVQTGDIAGRILSRHFPERNLKLPDLQAANPGVDLDRLTIGQILRIPPGKPAHE
jgi:nucleoid-associated protein YgaU